MLLHLFDLLLSPAWRDLGDIVGKSGAPRASGAPSDENELGEHADLSEHEDLNHAIRWATGIGGKDGAVDDYEVQEVIKALPEEKQRVWLDRWRRHVAGEPSPSAPAGQVTKHQPKKRYRSYVLHKSVKLAEEFNRRGTKVKKRLKKGELEAFLRSKGWDTSKATKDHFRRVLKLVRTKPIVTAGAGNDDRMARKVRRRQVGAQGRHLVKAPVLREQLFSWFCGVRGRIKGRLPMQVLRSKAMALRMQCLVAATSQGVRAVVPKIEGSNWLWRWRKTYNVSLRQPNKRWKVPRRILLARLRIMWLNLIRVRCLAMLALGYDLEVDNADQKPFHLNESGSKDLRTLELKGARCVTLKEIHAETRARWTAQTFCTSSKQRAEAIPPAEVLFKGADGVLRASEDYVSQCPDCVRVRLTAQVSNSGSYRMEHILFWMDRALKRGPGDDNRWRILLIDVYRAHLGDPVFRLAWTHRYIIILVGGGCTGVVQVCDTHLHAVLSQSYIELELADLFEQHEANPSGCPKRSRNACAQAFALVWNRPLMHLRASEGFLHNLITAALNGDDDRYASREIAEFWEECQMPAKRAQAVEEVCSEWEAHRLEWSFDVVYSLVEAFPLTGHQDEYLEGQEDEGEHVQEDAQEPWDDREAPSPVMSDGEGEAGSADPSRQRGRGAPRQQNRDMADNQDSEDLSLRQQLEVADYEHRLRCLDQAWEAAAGETPVQLAIANVRSQVLREASGRSQRDSAVAQVIRRQAQLARDVDAQRVRRLDEQRRAQDAEQLARDQASSYLQNRLQELVDRELTSARQRESDKERAKRRREDIRSAAVGFDLGSLGQARENGGGDFHRRNRFQLVERVFALGDERPAEMEANWRVWLNRFDDYGRRVWKFRWAAKLRAMMVEVLQAMEAGNSRAALAWHREITRSWRLDSGRLVIPAALQPASASLRASGSAASSSVAAPAIGRAAE